MPAPLASRLLIVNADDYGLSEGISEGILRAHREGIVGSTSVLAVGRDYARAMRALTDAPQLGVGVHLALVGEDPPVLAAHQIPSLVDGHGDLPQTWRALAPRLLLGRVRAQDLERELRAQIERVRAAHPCITHLDSHQHTHLFPPVAAIVVKLAREYGIRCVRVPRSQGQRGRLLGGIVNALADRLAHRLSVAGLRSTAASFGFDQAGGIGGPELSALLARFDASAATSAELIVHPGAARPEDHRRFRWRYRWDAELEALCDPLARRWLDERGICNGSYQTLADVGETHEAS